MAANGKRVVVWLRNDLRLHDNYSLSKAAELVKSGSASEVMLHATFVLVQSQLQMIIDAAVFQASQFHCAICKHGIACRWSLCIVLILEISS